MVKLTKNVVEVLANEAHTKISNELTKINNEIKNSKEYLDYIPVSSIVEFLESRLQQLSKYTNTIIEIENFYDFWTAEEDGSPWSGRVYGYDIGDDFFKAKKRIQDKITQVKIETKDAQFEFRVIPTLNTIQSDVLIASENAEAKSYEDIYKIVYNKYLN